MSSVASLQIEIQFGKFRELLTSSKGLPLTRVSRLVTNLDIRVVSVLWSTACRNLPNIALQGDSISIYDFISDTLVARDARRREICHRTIMWPKYSPLQKFRWGTTRCQRRRRPNDGYSSRLKCPRETFWYLLHPQQQKLACTSCRLLHWPSFQKNFTERTRLKFFSNRFRDYGGKCYYIVPKAQLHNDQVETRRAGGLRSCRGPWRICQWRIRIRNGTRLHGKNECASISSVR